MRAVSFHPVHALLGLTFAGCGTAAAVPQTTASPDSAAPLPAATAPGGATVSSARVRPLPRVELPQPRPWTPPKTGLPQDVVDEAAFLLAHGLGDPRGGEYREAKVVVGSLMGGEGLPPQEIHGWVSKDGKRVVAPNGLVYDAVSVGDKADLAADVRAEIGRRNSLGSGKRPPVRGVPLGERIGVRMLLVAGRPDLAQAYRAALPDGRNDPNDHAAVLGEFLSAAFDQMVTAHMRGDDLTALRVGRLLTRERAAFEAEGLRLRGPRIVTDPHGGTMRTAEQFDFLKPLPDLVADAERRLQAAPRGPFDPTKATVAELIDRLDEAKARQWGQPGAVNPVDDPIVAALVAKGDEAAPALLDAIEKDARLTRSVGFRRTFFPERIPISVKSAAYAAFRALAEFDEMPNGPDGRPSVEALRRFWAQNRGKSPAGRWFDTLADDGAGKRRWEEAAQRLFDDVGTTRTGMTTTMSPNRGPLKAEAVRTRSNPSLSDLLEKRAREIAADDPGASRDFSLGPALRMATDLGRWDPPRAQPVLRELTRQSLDAIAAGRMQFYYMEQHVVPALEARAKAGDRETWPDYVAWLGKLPAVRFESASRAFRPVVEHLDAPGMREAAVELFTRSDSDWNFARRLRRGGAHNGDSVTVSPLLRIPEIRTAVLSALDDPTRIGEVSVERNGTIWVQAAGQRGGRGGRDVASDPRRPKPEERRPYRVKDFAATLFERTKGAPPFEPYWPERDKDAAIRGLRKAIQASGDRVDEILPWPDNWREPDFRRGG